MNTSSNSELALTYSELHTLTNDIKNWRDIDLCIKRIQLWYETISESEDAQMVANLWSHLVQLEENWHEHLSLKEAASFPRYISNIFINPDAPAVKLDPEYDAEKMALAVIANAQLFTKMKDQIETASRDLHLGQLS